MDTNQILSLHLQLCRIALDDVDNSNWGDIYKLVPQLRQALACVVCSCIVSNPQSHSSAICCHCVCLSCKGGRKRLKPSCPNCKDYDMFVPNKQIGLIASAFRQTCQYLRVSELLRRVSYRSARSNLLEMIVEAADGHCNSLDFVSTPSLQHITPVPHAIWVKCEPAVMSPPLPYGESVCYSMNGRVDQQLPPLDVAVGAEQSGSASVCPPDPVPVTCPSGPVSCVFNSCSSAVATSASSCGDNSFQVAPVASESVLSPVGGAGGGATLNSFQPSGSAWPQVGSPVMWNPHPSAAAVAPVASPRALYTTSSSCCSSPSHFALSNSAAVTTNINNTVNNLLHSTVNHVSRTRHRPAPTHTGPVRKGAGAVGCRCGKATALPGKLTCCGQRCPCYVAARRCVDCVCRGCRNPHRADGTKVLAAAVAPPQLVAGSIQLISRSVAPLSSAVVPMVAPSMEPVAPQPPPLPPPAAAVAPYVLQAGGGGVFHIAR